MRAVAVLNVNNYRPDICEITLPNLKGYADRIGADFIQINSRKYPDWHPAYEKLQAWQLSHDFDELILIDADIILHPKFIDMLTPLPDNCFGSWMSYSILNKDLSLWPADKDPYFLRDGRNFGVVGSMVACKKNTKHIFKPLSSRHAPEETQKMLYRPAIIDEYVMSRNAAKYGLKYQCLWPSVNGVHHAELTTKGEEDALIKIKQQLMEWSK